MSCLQIRSSYWKRGAPIGMPIALVFCERATTIPSLFDSTITGRCFSFGLKTLTGNVEVVTIYQYNIGRKANCRHGENLRIDSQINRHCEKVFSTMLQAL